jgi:sigma-B regulation protein RsbU (phosphoserine phosphatase)
MGKKGDNLILVTDDDATSRRLLVRILSGSGYLCAEASNGVEALDLVRETVPSLLLLDFDMPGLDGAEMLRRLRRENDISVAQLPTIMLTAHTDVQSEVLCLEAGADDFVTKPINPAVLCARIETQLRLRSMRRQLQQQNDELEAWRQNLERDLAAARLTQQSLIPKKPPTLPGWDIAAAYLPVIQVGGDIYGWFHLRNGRTLFWIVDATGHGASAALLTTLAKLLFHHGAGEQNEPARIMEAVNNDFRTIFMAQSFMTAMCVALDPITGQTSVVGAGHPPLLIARNGGGTDSILSSAPPLGLLDRSEFQEEKTTLEPGDTFFLYTDGLCGSGRGENPRLSADRLGEMLHPIAGSAEALINRVVKQAIPKHGKPAPDDIAAVAVRRLKRPEKIF